MILICAISLNLNAQTKDMRVGFYSAHLYSVEAPKNKLVLDTIQSIYEDSLIKIAWVYGGTSIDFDLLNKSNQTLKIIWDDAIFISIGNESEPIFHSGIKYIDRADPKAPTSVYKNMHLSDMISPCSYSYFISGQYGGWTSKPLIPQKINVWSAKKHEYLPYLINQTMRVILPIKMGENTLEYVFSFRTEFISK